MNCGNTVNLLKTGYPSPSCYLPRGHKGHHTDGMGTWPNDDPQPLMTYVDFTTGSVMGPEGTGGLSAWVECSGPKGCGAALRRSATETHDEFHRRIGDLP